MFISPSPPPLPPVPNMSAGELCTRSLGQIPWLEAGSAAGSLVSSVASAYGQQKAAAELRKAEEAAIKLEREKMAREFALKQAELLDPDAQRRKTQTRALWAVGGVALGVVALVLVGTVWRK